jgi:hypothetical protein
VDVNLYAAGAKTIENLIVRPQGALFRRSGTRFLIESRDPSAACRLIPFEVSDVSGYELLFGDGYIWVFKDRAPLIDQSTDYDTAIASLANSSGAFAVTVTPLTRTVATAAIVSGVARVITTAAHGYRTGTKVKITGTSRAELDDITHVVTYVSTTVFTIAAVTSLSLGTASVGTCASAIVRAGDPVVISGSASVPALNATWRVKSVTAFDTYVLAHSTYSAPGGGANGTAYPWIVEVPTTFDEDELSTIDYAQSADVLYLAHEDHAPSKIQRSDDEAWSLSTIVFKDGPYLPVQQASFVDFTNPANGTQFPEVLFYISDYVHTATINVDAAFVTADNGKFIEYRDGDQWRLAIANSPANGALTSGVTIVDNVLLFLDETTMLTTGKRRVTPASVGNSAGVSSARSPERGASGSSRQQTTTPHQKKIDPRDELQASGGVLNSQYSNTFSYQDVGKYVRYHTAATAAASWTKIDGLVVEKLGKQAQHTPVTMTANNPNANAVVSAHSRTSYVWAFVGQVDPGGFAGSYQMFSNADIGRKIRMGFGGRWAWGTITALVSAINGTSSVVSVSWEVDLPRDPHNAENIAGNHDTVNKNSGWTYDWRFGAWGTEGFTGASYPAVHGPGYPRTVCFHEQRLVWGGAKWTPLTFWMSVSGDFENMLPSELDSTVLDDSAITYTLASAKANVIKWIISGPTLVIGTSGDDWQVRAANSINEAITPSNIKAIAYTSNGTLQTTKPAIVGSSVVFVDRSANRLHELYYAFTEDKVDTDELSVISEHILRDHGGAIATAYQQNPHSVYWILCADGTLVGVTINKKQEVAAWHHHTVGGGLVESISVIPSEDGKEDHLWVVVNRTISGSAKRTIEVLEEDFYPASRTSRLGMRFPDGHTTLSGWTSTVISGLNHLEGLSVIPVVDGVALAAEVVTGGAITMDSAAVSEVVIGIQSNANLESLPPEGGSQHGTSHGKVKRLVSIDFRWLSCNSFSFGPSASSLVSQSLPVNVPDASPDTVWFTGTYRVLGAHGYDVESGWYLRQANPYPLNVLFAVTTLETNE